MPAPYPDGPLEYSPPAPPPPPPPPMPTPSLSLDRSPTPSPAPSGSQKASSSSLATGLGVGAAIGGVAVLAVLAVLFIFWRKKRRRGQGARPPTIPPVFNLRPPNSSVGTPTLRLVLPLFMSSSGGSGSTSGPENSYPPPSPGIGLNFSKSEFMFEELRMATNGFSDLNLLGQGGFGYVHKGVLPNVKEVAVKQLKPGRHQGEREFQAKVEIISRVHHKHLVSLVGFCKTGSEILLVYEFIPNNTLQFHLHGVAT